VANEEIRLDIPVLDKLSEMIILSTFKLSVIIEAAGEVSKIGLSLKLNHISEVIIFGSLLTTFEGYYGLKIVSSLKSNHQIKLCLPKLLIHIVV